MTGACLLAGRVAALVPAAGSGTRLGRGPKAFVEVAGQSLLERSVRALAPHVDEVIVALPAGMKRPAGLAARAEPVDIRAAYQAGLRAERQRAHDVGAGADAAVEQNVGVAADRIGDARQHRDRR